MVVNTAESHNAVGIPEVRIGRDHGNLPCDWIPPHLPTEKLLPLDVCLVPKLDVVGPFMNDCPECFFSLGY